MNGPVVGKPDHTALRTALWRALHVELDPPPHVLTDLVGLRLAAPEEDWRERPDMDPYRTVDSRLGMVARARFVEDFVKRRAAEGVGQYVILGAGLDTFVQRYPDAGERLTVFEVDRPDTQAWKRKRLADCGFQIPRWQLPISRYRVGSGWFPSTSRQEHVGGSNWRSRDSTPVDPPWSRPRASACI